MAILTVTISVKNLTPEQIAAIEQDPNIKLLPEDNRIPEERAIQMFGATEKAMLSARNHTQVKYLSDLELAFSWLSDAQELVELGQKELARQVINRAKYMIDRNQPAPEARPGTQPVEKQNHLLFTDRECYHLIEALRVYQREVDNDEVDVDEMCERINFA